MHTSACLPPTSNTRSSHERAALVRSSRKLCKVLGDVPRVPDDDVSASTSSPAIQSTSSGLALTDTPDTESIWHKRKPTHLPPLLKLSATTSDTPTLVTSPTHHHRSSLSIVSNAPSTASETSERRAKLERLRRKLGDEVPATAVFPTTPLTTSTKRAARGRTCSVAHQADDARSIAFSISSDESVHTVMLTTRVHSPRPHRTTHVYHTGALPPVPPIPTHLRRDDDDAGLIRPRQKMPAGSKIGGSDFKAARRAKRERRVRNGMAEPGEMVEMVGFMPL